MSYGYFYNHGLPSIIRQIRKIKKFRQPKYYAVAVGRRVGIYRSWPSCKVQIDNIVNAKFSKFDTHQEAIDYLNQNKNEIPIPKQYSSFIEKEFLQKQNINNENTDFDTNIDIVYVDGACSKNGQPNACAGVGIYWPGSPEQNQSLTIDGRQTSIRAEIWAAIFAIRQAKKLGLNKLVIFTDSHFVIQAATVWIYKWKRNCWMTSNGTEVKNRYDMMALDEAIRSMKQIIWRPVPAHSGIPGNEEADRLANAAIENFLSENANEQQLQQPSQSNERKEEKT